MAALTQETALDLLEALNDLRQELRAVRREGLVARLSETERELIAARVFERVDERLAPAESDQLDEHPRHRDTRRFGRRS